MLFKYKMLLGLLFIGCFMVNANAQQINVLQYVNPFIGTTTSDVYTKWGNAGGAYPGAVAPSGYMQLTPETSINSGTHGYDYKDSSIYFFSCLHHMSGYPEGSSGSLYIMPVDDAVKPFGVYTYKRPFSHKKEAAQAGYYSVTFTDDNTTVEATATQRVGVFRITFPAHVTPKIFIGDVGVIKQQSKQLFYTHRHDAALQTSSDIAAIDSVKDGYVLSFTASNNQATVIVLRINVSSVTNESAAKNIETETSGLDFDAIKQRTQQQWEKLLDIVEITDDNINNKTVFYTALYHSLLLPWIVSDVDGNYRGNDRQIYHATGTNEYGGFSPWDTYRTLHPLLTLLYPEKQRDVVLSMLDGYKQTGYLPKGPMTGNHFIPIIADTWVKGIKGFDSAFAYTAMKKSILYGPFDEDDMAVYQHKGYIPFTYPESVTRTVEYAYDDWALSQYAQAMYNNNDYIMLLQRSLSYRQLFNKDALLALPRNGDAFKLNPGTSGYKEGDAYVYTYSVPHNSVDLVNLLGGNDAFCKRLDDDLTTLRVVFDNETVFHVPYLFNNANHVWLTQKWVRNIMQTRYAATPQGLPGNDDLGSMSAWYVFSALGLFPALPGSPVYEVGSPMFKKAVLHLPNGKQLTITANNSLKTNVYVQSLTVNGKTYTHHYIPHALIKEGGAITFTMGNVPAKNVFDNALYDTTSAVHEAVDIKATSFTISKNNASPSELLQAHFTLRNDGGRGTRNIKLIVNGKEYANKNCLVEAHTTTEDSIGFRLYPVGNTGISIEGVAAQNVQVKEEGQYVTTPAVFDMQIVPLVHKGGMQHLLFTVQNISGHTQAYAIPITLNGVVFNTVNIKLAAGEKKSISRTVPATTTGFVKVKTGGAEALYKVFDNNNEALLFNLQFDKPQGDTVITDASGFGNDAAIVSIDSIHTQNKRLHIGDNCFISLPHNASTDSLGETLTIMAWVYPETASNGLIDIFSKGDNHVLQLPGDNKLTFFAGGWGRGDCTVNLPGNWLNNWHHIAGVCKGDTLLVYIDGILRGTSVVDGHPNLTVQSQWQIGRNEEFPNQRIFIGYVDKAKVYGAALSASDIKEIVGKEKEAFR